MNIKDKFYQERELLFKEQFSRLKAKKPKRTELHCFSVIARKNNVSTVLVRNIVKGYHVLKSTTQVAS